MASVLYVDDEVAISRALRSWLSRRGHVVHAAASSDEAKAILAANQVDGVLIDIWLGDESGFDLFEWIDMHHPRVAEHAMFVTGDIVRDPEVERQLTALERPVVTKPYDLNELEQTIAAWGSQKA
jgi:DNA-binding NtrC family response regulator